MRVTEIYLCLRYLVVQCPARFVQSVRIRNRTCTALFPQAVLLGHIADISCVYQVEETHASLVNNSLGDGVTIKDAVEDEKKRSEKKKADMEAAMKINVETAEAAASSEHDSVSNEQSDEKSEVLTPKSKRKGFSFKVPVKKNK